MSYELELEQRCDRLESALADVEARLDDALQSPTYHYMVYQCGKRGRKKVQEWFAHHLEFRKAFMHCMMNQMFGSAVVKDRHWLVSITRVIPKEYEEFWTSDLIGSLQFDPNGSFIVQNFIIRNKDIDNEIGTVFSQKESIMKEIHEIEMGNH